MLGVTVREEFYFYVFHKLYLPTLLTDQTHDFSFFGKCT